MTEQEIAEEAFKKTVKDFFKSNVAGKSIDQVLYKTTQKAIMSVIKAYGQCQVIYCSLDLIKKDKVLFEKLDNEAQQGLNETVSGIKEICNNLENILNPIIDGLNS